MNPVIDRALRLWVEPVPADDAEALAAFATVYTDPVLVNGEPAPLSELVRRARALQRAFSELHHEITADVDSADRCAMAFRLSGRHTGPLETAIGPVAATGRELRVTGLDVFVLRDGLVAEVWAVADTLGLLIAAGALTPAAA
jgi:predicted ester cyclase